jgi:hypothetical protein
MKTANPFVSLLSITGTPAQGGTAASSKDQVPLEGDTDPKLEQLTCPDFKKGKKQDLHSRNYSAVQNFSSS